MGNCLGSPPPPSTSYESFHQLDALDIDKLPVHFSSLAGKVRQAGRGERVENRTYTVLARCTAAGLDRPA